MTGIPLSFQKNFVWYFAVGDPQCSYYQFGGLLQKKQKKKIAFCRTLSTLLVVLSISLVANSCLFRV
jgi:hypothetical protein